jgi:hypothetical protein
MENIGEIGGGLLCGASPHRQPSVMSCRSPPFPQSGAKQSFPLRADRFAFFIPRKAQRHTNEARMSDALKRYTELPFLLHMLRRREIALLSPASWDDRNDALYIEQYREDQGHKSVFALCLTRASTTYHHWKVFAGSTSGVCIYFNEQPLKDWASANSIRFEDVEYLSLRRARKDPPKGENLPFRKRHAFEDEMEVRLLYSSKDQTGAAKSFKFDLALIDKSK